MNDMNSSSTILAGIDFSDSSPAVLRHAIHAGGACGAKVVAVHVLDKGLREHREASGVGNPALELLKTQAEERFAELLAGKECGVEVEFIVKIGKPADELARTASDDRASFLVISANDLTKKRLGSIAARCLRMVPCDVLVLRDWQGGDFSKIVVCTDFCEAADRAIGRAALLAKQDGAHLEIVNVMYPPGRDGWGKLMEHAADSPTSYGDECKAAVKAKMDLCLKRNKTALEGVRYEAVILESEIPSIEITGHVSSLGADLVVMGTQSHSPLASHFIGTNAERLLHDAPVSVFAVR
jgi:nucleotide-binding universal stress UspA family protein